MLYIDKIPWKSKKFLAFIFVEIILATSLIILLVTQTLTWPLAFLGSIIVLTMGSLAIGYVLGQAALDRYVDGAKGLFSAFGNKTEEEEETYDS